MLADHVQQEFMSKIRDVTSVQIATFLQEIQPRENHDANYSDGGAYLPLSVWATKGWDPAQIEATASDADVMEDKRFGKLYRVAVLYKGTSGSIGFERKGKLQVRAATKPIVDAASGGAPAASVRRVKREPQASDVSGGKSGKSSSTASSDSSSADRKKSKKSKKGKRCRSSSSSDQKHKHRKHDKSSKKAKSDKRRKHDKKHKSHSGSKGSVMNPALLIETTKEKRARELQANAQAKQAIQQAKHNQKFCTMIISKLQPMLDAALAIKNGEGFDDLPRSLAGCVSDTINDLTDDIDAAKDVISDADNEMPFADAAVRQRAHSIGWPALTHKLQWTTVSRRGTISESCGPL
jgi:hypothetical protein